MGVRNFRRYEHIDIQTLLEPRDSIPAKKKREYKNVNYNGDNEEGLQE